jgi:Tfp pilus assembly protein PilF
MATTRKESTKEKSLHSDTAFDNDELLALAALDLGKGNTESALLKIKTVLGSANPPAQAYSMAARIYGQLRLFGRAQEMFKTYLSSNPESPVETFQLAMTYFDAGERQEALKIWEGILKKQPAHPPALFYRALALAQEGDTANARKTLEILLKSAPTDNLYFNQGKELLGAIERGEKAKAPASKKEADAAPGFLINNAYGTEH